MNLKAIYERKREAYAKWRSVMDAATKEDRPLSAEDQTTCNECETVIDDCNTQIHAQQEQDRQAARLAAVADELKATPPGQLQQATEAKPVDTRSLGDKLRDMTEQGASRREAIEVIAKQRDAAKNAAFRQYLLTGTLPTRAALQKDVDASGGFLLAPEQFIAQLIQDLDNMVWFRQFATVIPVVGAQGIGVPSLETDIADTTWTTELAVGTEDSSMVFGKRALTPHPLAKYIKVSKDLLRSAALSVESIVRQRLSYKFGTVQEAAFMTGSGSGSPLGIFTASDHGITTSRDVSTDNTATAITADGLINCKYGLSGPWLNSGNLRWVFHRDAVKMIRKLKDGEAQYLWQPGLVADRPDSILGVPVLVSEYAPNTFTASQYVGVIGDLSYYWIADNMSLEIQRLVELYALTNQDAFVGRLACDGMPVLEEAFIRVQLAAS